MLNHRIITRIPGKDNAFEISDELRDLLIMD